MFGRYVLLAVGSFAVACTEWVADSTPATEGEDAAVVAQYLTATSRTLPKFDRTLKPALDPEGQPLGPVLMDESYRQGALANSLRLEKDAANSVKVSRMLAAKGAQSGAGSSAMANAAPLNPLTTWDNTPCTLEVGRGTDRDRSGALSGTFSANGLQAQTSWTLQRSTTCVRSQGSRGTCVAFAINGAIETLYRRQEDKWINLSEQYLYSNYKVEWSPSTYGDGANTGGMLDDIVNDVTFFVPYEASWNYNRSSSRIANDTTRTYTRSCDGYTEFCSDTSGQPRATGSQCNLSTGAGCTFTLQGGGMGGAVANYASIWSSSISTMAANAHALSESGMPMVMSLDVTPSFDNAPSHNGFVVYAGANESSRGGHAVEVVGVLTDAEIANYGATILSGDSGTYGSGGGYFIIKNSWGTSYGDDGFAYLPYNWVDKYAYDLYVVDRVAPVDAQPATTCGRFNPYQGMFPNQPIYSCDGRFRLYLQGDSNLVLSMKDSQGAFSIALWATNSATIGKNGTTLIMQGDGNFVLYDSRAKAIWHTHTYGNPGGYLRVQNNGNMVVFNSSGTWLWRTNTGGH